jgi:hypothetical protein
MLPCLKIEGYPDMGGSYFANNRKYWVANENHSTHEILGGVGVIFLKTFDIDHAKVTLPHFALFHHFATLL